MLTLTLAIRDFFTNPRRSHHPVAAPMPSAGAFKRWQRRLDKELLLASRILPHRRFILSVRKPTSSFRVAHLLFVILLF